MCNFTENILVSFCLLVLISSRGKCFADTEVKEDWLLPYKGDHYDPRRTHRHVRSCQPIIHGNITHESFKPLNLRLGDNFVTSYIARHEIAGKPLGATVTGHVSFISNPLRTFSVVEPGHAGSCTPWTAPMVEAAVTARRRKCVIATNAGYFIRRSGGCLGNIYSDGKLIQSAHGIQNANFGVRKDGTIVTGYLSDDDVNSKVNPFVQLITGVGWLLRKGELYLNVSKKSECVDTEGSHSIDTFFNEISGRVAVGHDRYGRLVVAHVDGKTGERGVDLYTFAKLLRSLGVVNAINLDGGGSTTFVVNGTLANYPSDQCGKDFVCPRKVSTILCFHEPECSPDPLCSGNGDCVDGICRCHKKWMGESCNITLCSKEGPGLSLSSDSRKSKSPAVAWTIGFAVLVVVCAMVCVLNLYIATKVRASRINQKKEDLQRLLVSDNDDL